MRLSQVMLVGVMASLLSISSVTAQEADTSGLERLGIKVNEVNKTTIDDVYEVQSNQGVFYISKDGSRFFAGNMFDLTQGQPVNLTEQTLTTLRKSMFADLKSEAITFKSENQKHEVLVFTDTTCTYCRQLHNKLGQYLDRGITIHYVAFPRGGMTSRGGFELERAWCADDPKQALTDLKHDNNVSSSKCSNPVAKHYRRGQSVGVTGTPAFVLANGELMPGLRTPDGILEALENQ